ncbi:FAD-dependent pyridine nucleotide-disulphide oxidoreductase [Moorella glycerini]|uniref:NADH dehydrogenase-like protein n=1 Tax=Neomoorella stamsii TaxID=1266720 RepID=A0A9X7P781_9FIRM|nr:NADH dehydrogenase-like protein [Moorella stamsii]CEP67086.1 FAD-dependent pyridine nucleotide-disulphide oxidoreductase [Moorella glycerini]
MQLKFKKPAPALPGFLLKLTVLLRECHTVTRRIVIVGGGVAGTMVANRLAKSMENEVYNGELEVVLIGNTGKHIYQPGFLFMAFNEGFLEQFAREEEYLLHPKVNFVIDAARHIDVDRKRVITGKQSFDYDFLVIATGSYPAMDSVPGLAAGAHTFYTPEGAEKLRHEILNFQGGTLLVTIDVPHKCPVAPLEFIFMADDYYREAGIRNKVQLKYTYPIGRVHSLEPVAKWAVKEFEKRGIEYEIFFNLEKVDPEKKIAYNMDGSEHPYDLLISIPAHRGARVIQESGLGDEDGFIPTDRYSLKMEGQDCVYVIGDATDLPVSKAGSTAHYEADVVVKNLISELKGLPATHRYNGKAFCFIETGLNEATYITFNYKQPPQPVPPSEMLHWFKLSYNEMYWLSARGIL